MGLTKRLLEEEMEREVRTKTCPECQERTFEITDYCGRVSGECTECGYQAVGYICVECDDFFIDEEDEIICQDCFNKKIDEED